MEECSRSGWCPELCMTLDAIRQTLQDTDRHRYSDGTHDLDLAEENRLLEQENQALNDRVTELESRLKYERRIRFKAKKQTRGGSHHPFGHRNRSGEPRKRGAPVGHPPWQRKKPDHVDRHVSVAAPHTCPHCGTEELQGNGNAHIQLQEDIVLQPRTLVTEYEHELAYCPHCRREVFQTAEGELRNCEIGPVTQAAAVYLRHEVKLSYRDVQKVFDGLFGISFVPASAMAFSDRAAMRSASLYEDLRKKIRSSPVVHGDETHWRIDGDSAYLWYAGNERFDFFDASFSRGGQVAATIFGDSFQGGLVADSYAGYNAIHPRHRQACLAHLIRKPREIAERIRQMRADKQDKKAKHFCRAIGRFFAICCRIDQRRRDQRASFATAKNHIPRLQRVLASICSEPLKDADAENLRQRITDPKRDGARLFTFLEVEGMPPTNNHAEQALRLPVIFRKITYGSRSPVGARNLAKNLSILTTAKRQGKQPLQLLQSILLNAQDTPVEDLYSQETLAAWDSS